MLYDKLYDWQKKLVDKYKDRKSFGLFLDMGTGKTLISLALSEVNDCQNVMIITLNGKVNEPATKEGSWSYWGLQSKMNYTIYTKSFEKTDKNCILLTNYENLFERHKTDDRHRGVKLKQYILDFIECSKGKKVAIIIDESHKMKNVSSIQTKSINMIYRGLISKLCKVKTYLLTGTPFTSGYEDLYSQLKMLGYPDNKSVFLDRYCVRGNLPGLLGYQQPIVGYKNVEELFNVMHQYSISIESDSVVDLPEKIFIEHKQMKSDVFKFISDEKLSVDNINTLLRKRRLTEINLEGSKKTNNPFYRNLAYPSTKWLAETTGSFWMRCREASIGFQGNAEDFEWFDESRLKSLKTFLENNQDNYVLFYNYTPELYEIYNICEELGYNIDVYCGEVKSLKFYEKYEKQSIDERFNNRKNIIISNFASGSTGMNWQLYNKCIIFSLPVYKDYAQGIKRIHRIGQKQTVVYHIFYQDNFLDRGMKNALDEKCDYNEDMFESDKKKVENLQN